MSSTDLEAPSRKLLFAAIIIVLALHVLTVIALAAIKTPELKVENKIAFITLNRPDVFNSFNHNINGFLSRNNMFFTTGNILIIF